ncbi:MAG TPA: hypothetical protein VGR55_11250, partial [Candidatus Acidoferrum sp.]|nr:hypothetical protein [Candidatus Acidoferrum sp.]
MKAPRTLVCVLAGAACLMAAGSGRAQDTNIPGAPSQVQSPPAATGAASGQPGRLRITLQDAIDRARKNSIQFQAAVTNAALARQDRFQARSALLPTVTYNTSAIYTQSAGPIGSTATGVPVIFIANNAVHEYVSQGNVHEAIDVAAFEAFRRASSVGALTRAQQEIASRGLVVTVVQGYYNLAAAEQKVQTA